MQKHYKYVHIFHRSDTFFSLGLVRLISSNMNLKPSEHLYVTQHKEVYDQVKEYGNVVLYDKFQSKNDSLITVHMVNEYGKYCDWIFMHSLCRPIYFLMIHKKLVSKIIWRTWGHDTRIQYNKGEYLKNCIKKICKPLWKSRLKRLKAIGIANVVDEIDLSWIKGAHFIMMPYSSGTGRSELLQLRNVSIHNTPNVINVQIGHSGTIMDNHLQIIRKLEKWSKLNIRIHIVWAYYGDGDIPRLELLKKYIAEHWSNNVDILEKRIPYDQYLQFINQMDIVILDGKQSYALGNIGISVLLRKKIFLNRDGIIKQAFDKEHLPYCCTDQLDTMSYEEFISPLQYPDDFNSSLEAHGKEYSVQKWNELLDWLDQFNNSNGNSNNVSK